MNKKKKIKYGLLILLLSIFLSICSAAFISSFNVNVTQTPENNGDIDFLTQNNVSEFNGNFYSTSSPLFKFKYTYSPGETPGSICAGANISILPAQVTVDVSSRGWPLRYIYNTPPILCAGENNYTYLPVSFLLNVIIYGLIITLLIYYLKRYKRANIKQSNRK